MNNRILHATLFCPNPEGSWGLPCLLWGSPGTGKTSFVARAAERTKLAYERLSPAERGDAAFGIIPVPLADGLLHSLPPAWTPKFTAGGVLFIDEINTAPPALQAPLLGAVQLRMIGEHYLGKRTRVIAAANETSEAAGGWDLAPALANRFGHFDFEGLSPLDWTVGLMGGFYNSDDAQSVDAEVEEARVMKEWPTAIAMARGTVAAFIKVRPELLHKQPNRASNATSRAWPSRRSVEYATYAMAGARVHGLSEIDTDTFMAGFVGQAWVSEFATFRVNLDLPDPSELLDGKVKFEHSPRRLDRTMAVLSSIAAMVVPEKAEKREARGNAAWSIIGSVIKDAADVAMPAATALRRAQPPLIGAKFPASQKPLSSLWPVMKEAGLS